MLLLIGPAVAIIGIVAVVFVMRHKSVEKRSMYSSRRSQIEHKVRAARQRTLAPGRRADKADKGTFEESAAPAPTLTYETSAYAAPPVVPPPMRGRAAPAHPAWESEPAAPPASPPPFEPPAPAHEPPPYEAPAHQAPAAESPAWNPTAPGPARTMPAQEAATPAAAGAAWSVVGETKASAEPEPDTKKKKPKQDPGGAWSLASGEAAGDEADSGPKRPSAAIAVAQYAVLVVGLVMVLIGVVVMVANSHPS